MKRIYKNMWIKIQKILFKNKIMIKFKIKVQNFKIKKITSNKFKLVIS